MINCAAEAEIKSERIEIVFVAAIKFWDIVGITGEEVQGLLREASGAPLEPRLNRIA